MKKTDPSDANVNLDKDKPALLNLEEINDSIHEKWAVQSLKGLFPHLFDGSNVKSQVDEASCKKLVDLLTDPLYQMGALIMVHGIVSFSDEQKQAMIDYQILDPLCGILEKVDVGSIRFEACRLISTITKAGSESQIKAVVEANIIESLRGQLCYIEYRARKEAVQALLNILDAAMFGKYYDLVSELDKRGCVRDLSITSRGEQVELKEMCLKEFSDILLANRPEFCDVEPDKFNPEEYVDDPGYHADFQKVFEIMQIALIDYLEKERGNILTRVEETLFTYFHMV